MALIPTHTLQQIITGTSMIMIFVALKEGPLSTAITTKNWYWWTIGAILLFTYSHWLAQKVNQE